MERFVTCDANGTMCYMLHKWNGSLLVMELELYVTCDNWNYLLHMSQVERFVARDGTGTECHM